MMNRRGLTLIELLLALAGTALVATAIASMLSAVSYGTTNSRDLRELAVKNKALSSRVTAAIRQSAMVLESGSDYLVLWVYDLDGDGTPSVLELQRINYDAAADTLTSYEPDPAATDTEYDLADDFEAETDALIAADDLLDELWATNVTAWNVTLDDGDAQAAELLSFRITLAAGDMTDIAIAAVKLRN